MSLIRALVVDDSPAIREQLCGALRRIPALETVEAVDGGDAWRKLSSGAFDVVLTDVDMPVVDGLKLVGLVRSGGPHRAIPVVVVTSHAAEADRARAMSLGASAYLVKPFQPERVVDVVRALLRLG